MWLLFVGNVVWILNNIVFVLFYWEIDGGGFVVCVCVLLVCLELVFLQYFSLVFALFGWCLIFIDYLYFGFINVFVFSLIDVMLLVFWVKIVMGL